MLLVMRLYRAPASVWMVKAISDCRAPSSLLKAEGICCAGGDHRQPGKTPSPERESN